MKRGGLIGVLIFSLALNFAVAGTLVWKLWLADRFYGTPAIPGTPLTRSDFRRIASTSGNGQWQSMRQYRQQILQKNAEILDIIAANSDDPEASAKAVDELVALKGSLERQSIERIRRIVASLPEEKKSAFIEFMKQRTCMGPGMGWGRGRHRGPRGPHGPGHGPMRHHMPGGRMMDQMR